MPSNLFVVHFRSHCNNKICNMVFDRMLYALEYAVRCNGVIYQYSIQPSVNIRLRTKEPKKGNIKK